MIDFTNPIGSLYALACRHLEATGEDPSIATKLCDASAREHALLTFERNRAQAETVRLREDAERFRALMRCGRIKMQGSAGVDSKTGERTYPDHPGSVHFGAEFWVQPETEPSNQTIWGRNCLRALADDILAMEAAALHAPTM